MLQLAVLVAKVMDGRRNLQILFRLQVTIFATPTPVEMGDNATLYNPVFNAHANWDIQEILAKHTFVVLILVLGAPVLLQTGDLRVPVNKDGQD